MRKPALLLGSLVLGSACTAVHHYSVRPDYETADRTQTVRLAVFTSPVPEGGEKVAKLWSEIARKYANDHRDFIVKTERYGDAEPADLCAEGIEGVLRLAPKLHKSGGGVETELQAKLTRCRDGQVVWSADAGGTFASDDKNLTETTEHYVQELGEEVKPYVAPTFMLLRATLDTLPMPKMPDDNAVMEKIDLAE